MASNFLGDSIGSRSSRHVSSIISAQELAVREGLNLQKGMNFRDDGVMLSVFLVLPHGDEFKDEWHEDTQIYVYHGHDSTTVESGKAVDQLMMYESGKVTENGKFYKAAHAYEDGVRIEPLRVQVYEKLDPGVWFDKGIFELVDAVRATENDRKVFKFHLIPIGGSTQDEQQKERMISASTKQQIWQRDQGRCFECGSEKGIHFVDENGAIALRCAVHAGFASVGLL